MENIAPKKILFISHSAGLTGAEQSLLLLLKKVNRDKFCPIVVLSKQGELKKKILDLNIKTYTVTCPWWVHRKDNFFLTIARLIYNIIFEFLALLQLFMIIRREKIDLIYTNSIVVFSGAVSAKITKKPHVWHIREIFSINPNLNCLLSNKSLFDFITKSSLKIVATSASVCEQFEYGVGYQDKTTIIPNAVAIEKYNTQYPFPTIPGVSREDWIVCMIGTLQEGKSPEIAIQAIDIVSRKIPNIKLIIVGEGHVGFKNKLIKKVSSLNLTNKIIFTGFRADVPVILQYSQVILIPSVIEGFGRVAIEAMAAGIPVIGANGGGIREIVIDGYTGYLTPPNDPASMAEKIIDFYNKPQLKKQLGEAGRRIAEEKYSPEIYTRDVEKTIMSALK